MAKFSGKIGFVIDEETLPGSGIWVEIPVERTYRGETLMNTKRWQNSSLVNEDLTIDNKFSFVADSFALSHIGKMRYVKYLGENWKITSIEIVHPRMNIMVGGLYNGETPD